MQRRRWAGFATRRKAFVGLCVTGALALTGAAIAYFTASGSGTGTASVGTSASVTIHGAAASTLYPGTSSAVTFTADNPSSGNQQIGTIHLASAVACSVAFSGGSCPSGNEVTGCESVETGSTDTGTANFWMPDVVANQGLAPGNGDSITATGTLKMNDLSADQDACRSVNLLLNFTS
jgi:hypothetical protein